MPAPVADSGLFDLDQRPGKILRMQKQDRLAMRADLGLAISEHPSPFLDQGIAGGDDVGDLVADMVDAAVGIALQEFCDRRLVAQRLDELDLGVGQRHEDGDNAMLGQRYGLRDLGTEGCAVDSGRLLGVLHSNRDMIEPTQHRLSSTQTSRTCTRQSGFLPHCSFTTDRTARRTDSATPSGSRRRARGRPSTVETTTSNTISSSSSPSLFFSGMPTRSTSGSSASSPCSVIAIATKTQPANPIRRRSITARDLESSRIVPSL